MSKTNLPTRRSRLKFGGMVAGIVIVLAIASSLIARSAFAAAPGQPPAQQVPNDTCLSCHSNIGMTSELPNGDSLYLTIDPDAFGKSAHGLQGDLCVLCHQENAAMPHEPISAQSAQEFSAQMSDVCKDCHADVYGETQDSVHQTIHQEGNPNTPSCSDCHNPHYQQPISDDKNSVEGVQWKQEVPSICAQCHSTIYNEYQQSIHGEALAEGNADVPTCTDCHGVHDIINPLEPDARQASVMDMCGNCHTDEEMMSKYGITTNVLNSYVSDFHGASVMFSDPTDTNPEGAYAPVCYDCHGAHDIQSVDEPETGIAMQENLLVVCQECHPGAGPNFPTSWMGHYPPTFEDYPLVFFVNLFYMIMIPAVLGGMVIFVISDIVRRIIDSRKKKGARHS